MKKILLFLGLSIFSMQAIAAEQKNSELLAFDNKQPINITADRLEVDDLQKKGDFFGTVNVIQGKTHLRCHQLTIFYEKDAITESDPKTDTEKTDDTLSQGEIKKLVATGNVYLSSETNQAKADKMDYDLSIKKIVMTGNVLIHKDKNIIKGDKVDIYTETKQIYVHSNPHKRIQTIIEMDKK